MPRPPCCRRISAVPLISVFEPVGAGACDRGSVQLTLDELEALRLADLEGKYQSEAAAHMGISRATFGRIVESARRKVADALVHARTLRIEGGSVHADAGPRCGHCARRGEEAPANCPHCHPGSVAPEKPESDAPRRSCCRRRRGQA
jgi:predicted DNA-binding protein (UPF0251 family)